MSFSAPHWFVLVFVLAFAAWFWPRLGLTQPLRAIASLLVVLFLMGPKLSTREAGLDLWVLVDRSISAEGDAAQQLPEWETLLERSRESNDRIVYVDYAADAIRRGAGDGTTYTGDKSRTRTRLAIESALASMSSERAARLLVLTDGYATEPVAGALGRLRAQEVPLDVRFYGRRAAQDYSVAAIRAPARVRLGEPVLLEATIRGAPDAELRAVVQRGGRPVYRGKVTVENGIARFEIADRPRRPGAHRYEVLIDPKEDAHPGNNRRGTWVEVDGRRRVVVVTSHEDTPVAKALRAGGFAVEVLTGPELDAGRLSGAGALIFDDVPAYRVDRDVLRAIDFFVREEGGGFVMLGGAYSFGGGGYFESPIDPLLPVSMELRKEHKKLAVAMAIVLDRSCSMAARAGAATKMELAAEGSARAVELLGARDQVTVLAVDSEPHIVVPLTGVSSVRGSALRSIRQIESMGGGIYVYEGLKAAHQQLSKSTVGKRHVVLFSDAADSEEPGAYKSLIKRMVKEGYTMSVIGLGTKSDTDAALLEDIAKRGQGRMFFTNDPTELPILFAQETVAVARSAFIEEPVGLSPTGTWSALSSKPMSWLPVVDAYNLSYLREGASAAALSQDEHEAPLVAFWRRGLGRVGAVSFPLAGKGSESVRGWSRYGDFVQTIARWVMSSDVPPGVGMRTTVDGTELTIDLLYDEKWEKRLAGNAPRIALSSSGDEQVIEVSWSRLGPGHYRATHELPTDRWIRGAVQIGPHALAFGPVAASDAVEWAFEEKRVEALKTLARASGGEERLRLEDVWKAPRPARHESVAWFVLALALAVFLVEVLAGRLGWRLPSFALPTRSPQSPVEMSAPPEEPTPVEPVEGADEDEARRRRRALLDRAKRRK